MNWGKSTGVVIAVLLGCLLPTKASVLTEAVQVLDLSPEEASVGSPVTVEGVILSGSELRPKVFMLHDGIAVVSARVSDSPSGVGVRSNRVRLQSPGLTAGTVPGKK
jgi:hypothetical protein